MQYKKRISAGNDMGTERRTINYNVGALVVFFISMGVAAIVYAVGIISFNLFNLPAWAFGPLGGYTLVYSIVAGKDWTYYLVWGTIMVAVAIASALYYDVTYIIIVIGILVIILAIIGLVAYWRSKK